jgi:response regulator NasT
LNKILVADDDRVVLFTLAEGLRDAGFEVIEAHDGLQALALCQSEAPALALLDIRMPGLNGLQLARRLRDETMVPFMFFSAYGDEDFVRNAVEIGALGYLIKPLQVATIVPMIRTALARAHDISGLQSALASNRTIATAVGVLMRAEGIDQAAAFERLRRQARSERRKLEDLARSLVEAENNRGD